MRLFDLHCDTLYEAYQKRESLVKNSCAVDLRRGKQYTPWYQVFAVWIPDTVRGERAWRHCTNILSYAHEQSEQYDEFCIAQTYEQFTEAGLKGGVVGLLGVEGGAALAGKPERLAELASFGVKVITVTWNGSNELGNGCMSDDAGGLTEVGKAVVRDMERYGIVPDVSHLNEAGFWDVALATQHAFMASHSVSMTVNEHPRNLRDDQFCLLRDRGGLVGLTVCAEQLGEQSFECLYRHLDHYWQLGGRDTVALGFDLDGTVLPSTWRGIDAYAMFAEYLQKRGVDTKSIDQLFFFNAYRFFSSVLQR